MGWKEAHAEYHDKSQNGDGHFSSGFNLNTSPNEKRKKGKERKCIYKLFTNELDDSKFIKY
jgi:hypothetical protein